MADNFYDYMEKRYKSICKGKLGCNPKHRPLIAENTIRNQPVRARVRAKEYSAMERGDPFAENRALAHYRNGLAELDDYGTRKRP
jgi:hypothetical protein